MLKIWQILIARVIISVPGLGFGPGPSMFSDTEVVRSVRSGQVALTIRPK